MSTSIFPRRAQCKLCYGRAIVKDKQTQRWIRCICGRLPDSKAALKLIHQDQLDQRFEELKTKGW